MNIVVTGASRGLGKAVAEIFASHGHDLYLTSFSEVKLYKAMEEIQTRFPGITVKAAPFDLSKKENAMAFGNWVLSHTTPDVLVNNAGNFLPGTVYQEKDGFLEAMIETNLYSAYHLTRSVLPAMMQKKSGHIFNMCSIASLQAYPNGGAYSISKSALYSFTKNLREEMKPHGIKVTAVIPGAAYTDSWAASGLDQKLFMEAADIAKMIFAASQLSATACVEEILMRPIPGDIRNIE